MERKSNLLILLGMIMCLILSGCNLTNGNDMSHINTAVQSVEEQYEIHLTINKKNLFPRGVNCDVLTRCEELPEKDIRVFWYKDSETVKCDYIFVKYGDTAYNRIHTLINGILPESKIVVDDFCYNHFNSENYDKNTTLEDYLQNNDLRINLILSEIYDEEKLRTTFHNIADALIADGINCDQLTIYCMNSPEAAAAVKTYDHIPDAQEFKTIAEHSDIAIRAQNPNYCDLQEYIEEHEDDPKTLVVY